MLVKNDFIIQEGKYNYLSLILEYADLEDIVRMNNFDGGSCIRFFW